MNSLTRRTVYSWKRFWCARHEAYRLDGEGFLADPEDEWGALQNPTLHTFDLLSALPCLAMLGEPGIGKSKALEVELEKIEQHLTEDEVILSVDLRSVGSEDRLIQKIFANPRFVEWLAGKHRLYLFLDSLDECRLRVSNVSQIIIDELKNCPVDRLSLRIACRTAVWPAFLEDGLAALWGKEQLGVVELVPLRRQDIALAAKAEGVDPEAFFSAVRDVRAAAFAIKPVTLFLLFNQFKEAGGLPASQKEIYTKGCHILCEEINLSRRASGNTRQLSAAQRLAVASRIAAVMIFSNSLALYLEPDLGTVPDNCLPLDVLVGGSEQANALSFGITEETVRETLDSGLFTSRGSGLIGWAHQTYTEFLAAHYLLERQVPVHQIMAMITHAGAAGKQLVPQLHETTAWLATGHPEILRTFLTTEPLVILTSDVAAIDADNRAAIVERLLQIADQGGMVYREVPHIELLRKLNHPGLAVQLRPYLTDKTKHEVSRYTAIDIAEACSCTALQEALLTIGLDATEPLILRIQAAYAIGRIGDTIHKESLRPLASGSGSDDPDDELKGCALLALWPGLCTAQELFSYLTPPKNETLIGAYASFLFRNVTENLIPADLPHALQWASHHPDRFGRANRFGSVVANILHLAWQHLDYTGVLDAFVDVAFSRIKAFEPFYPDSLRTQPTLPLAEDTAKRRKLITALVWQVQDIDEEAHLLAFANPPLFATEDFGWLLEQAFLSDQETIGRTYALIARRLFNRWDTAQFDAVYIAAQSNAMLRHEFADILDPIVLGSEKAQQAKQWYKREREFAERSNTTNPALIPSPAERVQRHVTAIGEGNTNAWIALNRDLQLEPEDTCYTRDLQPDLTMLPGWQAADGVTRQRIVAAAELFLYQGDPQNEQWIGTNSYYLSAWAGYRAFQLLVTENASVLEQVPPDIWAKWTAIALFYPVANSGKEWEQYQRLLPLFYQQAPHEFISALIRLIDRDNAAGHYLALLDAIEGCWDEELATALMKKAEELAVTPPILQQILGTLFRKRGEVHREPYQQVIVFAINMINAYLTTGAERERALMVAEALLTYCPEMGWDIVWLLINSQPDVGRVLFENLAYKEHHASQFLASLTEERLGTLYQWLVEQYPYTNDPHYTTMEAHFVGPDESVRQWRDTILQAINHRGTHQACITLEHLVLELPHLIFLPYMLRQARDLMLRQSWDPLTPHAILRLTQDSDARLVRTGDDLLRVVGESLDRLQRKLQGETYAAPFLWDHIPKRGKANMYRPKDENSLSDFVTLHLDDDLTGRGIVANREVEIRRGRGNTPGERTDIHIDAVAQSHDTTVYQKVTVIIETKGCWNKDLLTAMESQLTKRYLKDSNCQHGIYLVGWYECPQWDISDSRKKGIPAMTHDKLRTYLDHQAGQLTRSEVTITSYILNASLR